MAEYAVFVNGVERPVLMDSLSWQRVANGIGTLQCAFDSDDASYRPEVDDELVLKRDGTAIWGGYNTTCPEENFGGVATDGIKTTVTAASYEVILTYRFVTLTIPSGTTLEGALDLLAPYLRTGFAIDPAQATGPTLPELTFTRVRLDSVLATLFTLTDWLYKITPSKYLLMYDPLAAPAPFDILNTGDVHQIGDVTVDRTLNEFYANRAFVEVTTGPATSPETFVAADGVSSGGFTRFTAKYPASHSINDVYPNILRFDGVVQGPIGFESTQLGPADWYWDTTVDPAQLVYPESGGRPFPTGAEVIDIEYAIRYPFTVESNNTVEQAARGIRERIYRPDAEMTLATAQAYADAVVANTSRVIVKPAYTTHDDGLEPGMIQEIEQPKRDLDGDFLILDVKSSMPADGDQTYLRHDVTCVEGTNVESDWRKVYKDWLGGGTSSTGGAGSVSTSGVSQPCVGEFIDIAFNAGNFTANNGGAWTLVSGDQIAFYYLHMGPSVVRIYFHFATTSVSGGSPAPTELRVAIPFTNLRDTAAHPVTFVDNGTAIPGVNVSCAEDDTFLTISGWDAAALAFSTNDSYVMGAIDIMAGPLSYPCDVIAPAGWQSGVETGNWDDHGITNPMTLMVRVSGYGGGQGGIIEHIGAFATPGLGGWQLAVDNNSRVVFQKRQSMSVTSKQAGSGVTIPASGVLPNGDSTIFVTYDPGASQINGAAIEIYYDGVWVTETAVNVWSGTSPQPSDAAESLVVGSTVIDFPGGGGISMTGTFNGTIVCAALVDRILTPSEMAALS